MDAAAARVPRIANLSFQMFPNLITPADLAGFPFLQFWPIHPATAVALIRLQSRAMELILIRHGLPEVVITDDGSPADPPLTARGHAQAAATAALLSDDGLDRIYSSPLRRAHQTALPLAERMGLEIELEPRVAEYDRDSDTYIPLEELKRTQPEEWRDFMKRGYPEGMNLDQFHREVVEAMEEIIADNRGRRVAVVCHGGVINSWASHILDIGFRAFLDARYASVNRFMAAGGGERSVVSLNEAAHLRALL